MPASRTRHWPHRHRFTPAGDKSRRSAAELVVVDSGDRAQLEVEVQHEPVVAVVEAAAGDLLDPF